ncbi:hypothetical protein OsJ_02181 [Oryza sativa Japonica Group]|uniref:SnoaL-like domain-containing protein n=1 Tax=Oryza sativa subsp. japonica TaxID=39947 RepID=A2ZU92_ORYSJ|nr:hypothetical protein OsJ_02181 [Oryza sativa Japonica Group]
MDGYRALIAAGATAVCCLVCAVWAFSSSSSSSASKKHQRQRQQRPLSPGCCGCARCGCRAAAVNGEMAVGGEQKKAPGPSPAAAAAAAAAGASMMEQARAGDHHPRAQLPRLHQPLPPLHDQLRDAPRRQRRRRLEGALPQVEQHNITPPNGWKAYYAATKAIMNVNTEFYNIIREGSLPAMSHFWLNADYVKCIHATGELFTGYNAVMDSWGLLFNWGQDGGQGIAFQLRDVRARVLGEVAWVNMKAHVDVDPGHFHVTNVYEFRNGRWYMVHHHSSLMADPAPHNLFA